VVLVVDDVHWATPPTLQLLGHVTGSVEASRAVLICTARNTTPDESAALAALVGELERRGADSHQIELGGLQAHAVGELVERVLQRRPTQPAGALARALHRDTAGNPLLVRALLAGLSDDQEWSAGDMPRTVAETVRRRLRRLPEELSQVLRAAAVVGLEFDLRLVARASGHDELATLEALELADRAGLVDEAGVNRYRFVHALVRATLREELSESRRVRLHQRVGEAIEELFADCLPEQYEALAHHYHEALEWEKALEFLAKAGDKAGAAYANHDAVAFYGRALEACDKLGDGTLATAATLAHQRALVQFGIGNFTGAAGDFERKRAAAIALGDRSLEGVALAHRGMAEFFNHQFATAETTLRAALTVADEGFDQCRALASLLLAALYLALGRRAESDPLLAVVEQQEARLEAVGRGMWSWLSGRLLSFAGRFDEALRELERQRPAAEASMPNLLWHGWIEGCALAGRGDYQAALARLEQTLATCERMGDVIIRMRLLNTFGWIHGELQDHQRALALNKRGLDATRASGTPMAEVETHTLLNLGENLLALGRLDEAEDYFRQVEEVVRHPLPNQLWVHWRFSERFFHSYGELRLARGDTAAALALADECLALASRNGSTKVIVKGRRLRGQALVAQGRLELAEQELDSGLVMAKQVANPPQLWKTYVALGELRRAQGRTEDARQAYRDALAVIETVAAGLTDESLRPTFLASDHVQGIRDAAASPR
jgi:tetratricopeptide (TPR) repeat protein